MNSPLIKKLSSTHKYPTLDAENYDLFVHDTDYAVLFFANNPVQFPESNDVAVILPELLKAFKQPLKAALISSSIERELQRRFRFTHWPSLVFLKRGDYLGVLSGILDWSDYLTETTRILASEPGEPPAFEIDKVCGGL